MYVRGIRERGCERDCMFTCLFSVPPKMVDDIKHLNTLKGGGSP